MTFFLYVEEEEERLHISCDMILKNADRFDLNDQQKREAFVFKVWRMIKSTWLYLILNQITA